MRSTSKALVLVILLLAAALAIPGCITIDEGGIGTTTTDTFEETYPVTAGASLDDPEPKRQYHHRPCRR